MPNTTTPIMPRNKETTTPKSQFFATIRPPITETKICALTQADKSDVIGIHHFMCQKATINSDSDANVPAAAKTATKARAIGDAPCLSEEAFVVTIVVETTNR